MKKQINLSYVSALCSLANWIYIYRSNILDGATWIRNTSTNAYIYRYTGKHRWFSQALAATHKIYQRGTPEGERAFFRTHDREKERERDFRVNVTRVFVYTTRPHFIRRYTLSSVDFLIGICRAAGFSLLKKPLPQSIPRALQKFFNVRPRRFPIVISVHYRLPQLSFVKSVVKNKM